MKKEIKTEIEICTDCYYYHQYGSESFNESQHLNDDEKQNIINSFKKLLDGYKSHNNRCCCAIIEPIIKDTHFTLDFSKNPCDICKSHLAGHRFQMEINIGFNEVKNRNNSTNHSDDD